MKRVLTAAVLIPPTIYLIFGAPTAAVVVTIVAVAAACFHEYLGLVRGFGWGTLGPFGYAAGLVVLFVPGRALLVLTLLALLALILSLGAAEVANVLPQAAAILFGVVYIFGAWRCAIALHGISPHWLFFALVLNWIGDSAAYYVGRAIGKHRLAPVLSPKKSWEGAIASVVASLMFALVYLTYFKLPIALWEIVALAVLANVAGQLGDLCESAIKRGAGVKDSGSTLPGHGGWLDRLDSSLFALPMIYFWLAHPWQF